MRNTIVIILCALVLSCGKKENIKPEINIEKELLGIDSTRDAFQKALKTGNFEVIGNLVTKDVITVSPGSSDWAAMYKLNADKGPFPYDSIIMNPLETIIANDSLAYDFGISRVFYTDTVGNVVELKDTFLAILKKSKDGIWRLHREVASSNVKE